MTITDIISIINLVGLATIVPIGLGLLIEKKKKKFEAQQQVKDVRYKAIILLCHYLLHFEKEHSRLIILRANLKTKSDLENELYTEWVNMALFGSDKTVLVMKTFLKSPDESSFRNLVLEMKESCME